MDPAQMFKGFLASVETVILEELHGAEGDLMTEAQRHLCLSGGKRARPLLVRIFGENMGVDENQLVEVAVAAELMHTASLLHDDVVDAGMYRRGRPTVNARWGNIVAVMSGDLLLSGSLRRLAIKHPQLMPSALGTVQEMTRAAIAEVDARGDVHQTLEGLRSIAVGKTGSLFGWCGHAAATIHGDPEAARHFDAFGRELGVAFQMADDIRDITGTDEGKPQYADIASRTAGLPIIVAVRRDPALARRIHDAWSWPGMTADRVRELGIAVLCSGALDEAIELMSRQVDTAIAALGPYAETVTGAALVHWASKIVHGLALKGAA